MPSGIRHIEFWVSDLERSLSFYDGFFPIVGFRKVDANGFSDGNTKIYLRQHAVARADTVGPRHICFHGDSRQTIDAVAAYARSAHCDVIRGPMIAEDSHNRTYTIDFRDPDGYVLEVKHTDA